MNGLENAQHDLSDARFSLETAIDLLSSIDSDRASQEPELHSVIEHLQTIKNELTHSFEKLQDVSGRIEL
jgi:hypothetical protein